MAGREPQGRAAGGLGEVRGWLGVGVLWSLVQSAGRGCSGGWCGLHGIQCAVDFLGEVSGLPSTRWVAKPGESCVRFAVLHTRSPSMSLPSCFTHDRNRVHHKPLDLIVSQFEAAHPDLLRRVCQAGCMRLRSICAAASGLSEPQPQPKAGPAANPAHAHIPCTSPTMFAASRLIRTAQPAFRQSESPPLCPTPGCFWANLPLLLQCRARRSQGRRRR